ncbi:hypothetical protein NFB71_02460 [Yersinia ruckeri]|uniref:hypothetical protein n=1 Tax=Yersinia ruckeri TaxID=29486 RepID=UPI0008FD65EF|nr:hypothetical protein [Yersinia ruckeri]MCW6525284.1 hypothetical protein [Yersinia ruckeri]MCW6592930.1 hypothetical protein [Yersinia ruckeri]MCW6605581.1 hypothetical protein [Yersinia ruckeri]OIX43809.1 hypothetical protein AXW22_17120 [Yersinia ruckeri]OJC86740.1 hypothetical protein AXW45_17695 [Yersinia ruckeri]
MKTCIRFIIPLLVSGAFLSSASGSDNLIPSDELTKEAGMACIGLAQKHSAESRRFNPDDMKEFIIEQTNDCRVLLSYSMFKPKTAGVILDKIESDYGRFSPDVSGEEIKFRNDFHKNIMLGVQKAANDKDFRDEMVTLGGFAVASPAHRNF